VSVRKLLRLLAVYAALLLVAATTLYLIVSVDRTPAKPRATIVSVWWRGERTARAVTKGDPTKELAAESGWPGAERVFEEVLDEAPLLATSDPIFGASFMQTQDGIKATLGDKEAYLTPDDLLKAKLYGGKYKLGATRLSLGLDRKQVIERLAGILAVSPAELLRSGTFKRVAVRRRVEHPIASGELSPANLRKTVIAAGEYLARALRENGSYRYEIEAITGKDAPGYNWPRHAGATWFLAQAADLSGAEPLREAARRAAYHLVERATYACGPNECIGEGDEMNLGSASLGLLTYVELIHTGIAPELMPRARALAQFIRSLQRDDGEFMHVFDRTTQQPVDIQKPYFAGEAALALARVHRVTKDPRDLDAARRALSKLVVRPAAWLTARFFWTAEHWTCQAMEDLWDRAPDQTALEFCLRWQESTRAGLVDGDVIPEYDGAYSPNVISPPRFTGSASRMEAGVATLAVAKRAGIPEGEVEVLEHGVRRTLSFLLRHFYMPGPTHLMPDPRALHGGIPGGVTDLNVRIDYPQHAGAALLRYLRLIEKK
jgi:hypothetical protein